MIKLHRLRNREDKIHDRDLLKSYLNEGKNIITYKELRKSKFRGNPPSTQLTLFEITIKPMRKDHELLFEISRK